MDHPLQTAALAVAASSNELDRAYELRGDEPVPDGIRRIARGQLDNAHGTLSEAAAPELGKAVHETRKSFKRLRASVRLARDAIGEPTYERENTIYRTAAGRLAAGRDAQVMLETLDALIERYPDELPLRTTATLRARLEGEHERAAAELRDDDAGVAAVLTSLELAIARTPDWTFERDGFDALSPGLRRIYRRGRKRMRAAHDDPSPENLHAWRKRVKDLWHASQIVRPAQPKRLKRLSRDAHDIADLLGDANELSVLREYVAAHPQAFEDDAAREALLAAIDRRSSALRRRALKRGRRLYKRSPKKFVGAIERGWAGRVAR